MLSPVQKKIFATIEKLENLKSIARHYDESSKMLADHEHKLADLNKQLDKELKDIERLEGLSVKGMFHSVLGNKDEEIEKERQEYLHLSLQHQDHIKEIELLEYELSVLSSKMEDLTQTEAVLENLKKEREEEILSSPSTYRDELLSIHHEMDQSKKYASELTEAYRAGDLTRQSLNSVLNHLNNAVRAGDWGRRSRRGYHDNRKYNSVDHAINEAYRSKQHLAIFARELQDVGYQLEPIDVEIKGFGGFMERLFDNLITDWVFQNKINNALSTIQRALHEVSRVTNSLQEEVNKENNRTLELENQKDALLVR